MPAKTRNASIDIFRYIAALLVVSLHVTAFVDIHPLVNYLFAQILPRISVPFFFTVSGYYFTSQMEKKTVNPQKYITKIMITYALWSCLYYLVDFAINHTINFKDLLYSFFISGSSYHFWFFPAIIFSAILTTVIFKIKCQKALIPISIVLYLIACLSNGYYAIGSRIPILSTLLTDRVFDNFCNIFCFGFSYFICGYLIFKSESIIARLQNLVKILLCIAAFLFFVGEVVALKILNWAENISVTLGLYILIYFLIVLSVE